MHGRVRACLRASLPSGGVVRPLSLSEPDTDGVVNTIRAQGRRNRAPHSAYSNRERTRRTAQPCRARSMSPTTRSSSTTCCSRRRLRRADNRGDCKQLGAPHRHRHFAPHLGRFDNSTSAPAHDCTGRRHGTERNPTDILTYGLPASRASVLGKLFRRLFFTRLVALNDAVARFLRINGAPRRAAGISAPPGTVRTKRRVVFAQAPSSARRWCLPISGQSTS